MNLLFSNLAVQYPTINKTLLKAILKNILALVNILKLSTDYMPDPEKLNVLKVNNMLKVNTLEKDILLLEVKGSSHLI